MVAILHWFLNLVQTRFFSHWMFLEVLDAILRGLRLRRCFARFLHKSLSHILNLLRIIHHVFH